ncbi:GH116 family glycosyl hydrolase [Bacteroidota bacterium]
MRIIRTTSPKIITFLFATLLPIIILAQERPDGPYIPIDKNLDTQWVESLFLKGEQKVYSGNELDHIAMPCGGIGAGQVEVTGDGRICFTESVYNVMQKPNAGHGLSTGWQYMNPQVPESMVENEFSISIEEQGGDAAVYSLSGEDFDDIHFVGEYPIARLEYRRTSDDIPVKISSEVFSPFVPLDLRSSANPVTVLKYSVTNTSSNNMHVSIKGELKNIVFPEESMVEYVISFKKSEGLKGISSEMRPLKTDSALLKHPQLGGFSLCVLGNNVPPEFLKFFGKESKETSVTTNSPNRGGLNLSLGYNLKPGESQDITFLITWYFPNHYENGRRYREAMEEAPGWVGHIYNNWYSTSYEVAEYIATNFDRLYSETKLFRETYNDNTIPYWLANRITMPVSTLAAGNIAIWQNGRMYGYEGIGFCQGTCGHVYNFVTAISRLFPELERSVRLMQDLSDSGPYSGYSSSGRINFRGYGVNEPSAKHSYASDAQSGYVLKIYREHLMSSNYDFLDSVWEKTKYVIGYQIFKDGAEIGLEPNGVLEGEQTFWDPMWYGPNPYNNTLYLAALRAAEEMALIKGEKELADRYHSIFEKGQKYMNEKMWNGEFYVHLYPTGLKGNVGIKNGFKEPEEIDDNARGFIEGFNQGEPNYLVGGACDANQLFGQNWANQLGLGYILPPENCKAASKSIFKYCYTPDIATVYDFGKPKHRTLAASGEAAMVNAGWPKSNPQNYENTHDKTDIWSGLEYEASCDMINEGLLKEAFIAIGSINDRYDGVKRNPWNEIEGSDHYSRAMHSWNVLLSLSGFVYDGPAGRIGFAPRMTPEDFKCFFSAAEGWGSISQIISDGNQVETIEVKWGQLRLNQLEFAFDENLISPRVKVTIDGKPVPFDHKVSDGELFISFNADQLLEPGQQIKVQLR